MAPVPVPEPNIHGPEDRGPALVAMHSVWSVIAIAFMAARVRSRLMQHYLGIEYVIFPVNSDIAFQSRMSRRW